MMSTKTDGAAFARLRNSESILGGCVVTAALGFLLYTLPLSAAAAAWPRTVLVLLLFLGLVLTVRGSRTAAPSGSEDGGTTSGDVIAGGEGGDAAGEWSLPVLRGPALTLLIVVAYVALVGVLGFFPATFAYLLGHLWHGGVRDPRVLGGVAIVFVGLVYLLFVYQLQVPLPTGPFG